MVGVPITAQLQSPIEPLSGLDNFTHRTEIPGGFTTLTYALDLTQSQWETWLHADNRKRQLLVRDLGGFVIWDGRLEDIEAEYTQESGMYRSLFRYRGYAQGLNDKIDNTNHSATTGEDIVISFLSDGGLDSSQEFITAGTGTISLDRSGLDLSMWRTIADSNGLRDIPSSNGVRIDFMVYEDKKAHYVERVLSSTPWVVSIQEGDILSFSPHSRWRDFATSVAGRSSTGISAFTSDSVAIADYGTRERVVGNSTIDATTAANMVTATLDERKTGLIRIEDLSILRVRDSFGSLASPCKVRAGDTILLIDLFSDSPVDALNNKNTFYVTFTECAHRRGVNAPAIVLNMRLDVDRSDDAGILAANGIRAIGE